MFWFFDCLTLPMKRSGTFLHEACRQCDVEVAALLLYFCANPNYLDEVGVVLVQRVIAVIVRFLQEGNPPLSHIPEDRKDFRDNFSAAACLRQTLSSGLDSRSSGHWPTFLTEVCSLYLSFSQKSNSSDSNPGPLRPPSLLFHHRLRRDKPRP